jgi:hypothetical protein
MVGKWASKCESPRSPSFLSGFVTVGIDFDFICFLADSLHFRLRRRERHMWTDTPIAYLFSAKDDWHLLKSRAKLEQARHFFRTIFLFSLIGYK